MVYKPDELREMIPEYLNNALSEPERQAFEESLKEYPEVEQELREFSEIKSAYRLVEDELTHLRVQRRPSGFGTSRLPTPVTLEGPPMPSHDVSGCTVRRASLHPGQIRDMKTQNRRSRSFNLGRF